MVRTVKKPQVRRAEILEAAGTLFQSQGYETTSVDAIVQAANVAKGTFYYYFKSKEDVLDALAHQIVNTMAEQLQAIANAPGIGAVEKICMIVSGQKNVAEDTQNVVDSMHRPENRALHDRSNIETVRILGPIIASVVEQGCRDGVFQVDDPLGTVQFILAGSLFLFGDGVFNWTPEEEASRTAAMVTLMERSFGASAGSFAAVLKTLRAASEAS